MSNNALPLKQENKAMVFLYSGISNLLRYLKASKLSNSSPSTQILLPPSYHHRIDHHKFLTKGITTTPLINDNKFEVLGLLSNKNKGLLSSSSYSYAPRKANSFMNKNKNMNTITKLILATHKELLQWLMGLKLRRSHYLCATMIATMCLCCRVEKVPFSERHHLVIKNRGRSSFSLFTSWVGKKATDRYLNRRRFQSLPPTHPKSIQAAAMVREIVQAMHTALGLEKDCEVTTYAPGYHPYRQVWPVCKSNNVLKSSVINRINNNNNNGIFEYGTKHLEGREWKVVVLDTSTDNAMLLPNYTIGIDRGSLDCSDSELAWTVSHEVGHAIGRHRYSIGKMMWVSTMMLIIFVTVLIYSIVAPQYIPSPERMDKLIDFLTDIPRRRMEFEADYIGMMLMASAGYDPQAALNNLLRHAMDDEMDDDELPSSHPPTLKRVHSLKMPETMAKAIDLYNEAKASKRLHIFRDFRLFLCN